jgi:hypothetical protein
VNVLTKFPVYTVILNRPEEEALKNQSRSFTGCLTLSGSLN